MLIPELISRPLVSQVESSIHVLARMGAICHVPIGCGAARSMCERECSAIRSALAQWQNGFRLVGQSLFAQAAGGSAAKERLPERARQDMHIDIRHILVVL